MSIIVTSPWTQDEKFNGIDLNRTNLSLLDLKGANLKEAYLYRANLERSYLDFAHLEGANLRHVEGLTTDQVKQAYINGDTHLPDYLQAIQLPDGKGDIKFNAETD